MTTSAAAPIVQGVPAHRGLIGAVPKAIAEARRFRRRLPAELDVPVMRRRVASRVPYRLGNQWLLTLWVIRRSYR